jgi:thiol-disulfide isomerase/thioredoxin
MNARSLLILLPLAALAPGGPAPAQEPAQAYGSLEDLRASYAKRLIELDRRRLADLTALAARQTPEEAEPTYRELFRLAVARNLYTEAQSAAAAYLKAGGVEPEDRAIAALVLVISQADRGEFDRSLESLAGFIQSNPVADEPTRRLDPSTAIAVGESYLQRLVNGQRYDVARKACEMVLARKPGPEVREHFEARLKRLKMLDAPAPEIAGRDVEGDPLKLSDLKGKVVLVDFWATWCPPCVEAIPDLRALQAKYGDEGFTILGINLDAHRDDVEGIDAVAPIVKGFVLNARVTWPSILLGEPKPGDPADLYGVEEIPASFLVDKQGKDRPHRPDRPRAGPGRVRDVEEVTGPHRHRPSRRDEPAGRFASLPPDSRKFREQVPDHRTKTA